MSVLSASSPTGAPAGAAFRYGNGPEARLGDTVALGERETGIVVCCFDRHEFGSGFHPLRWASEDRGILVDFPAYGLMHFRYPEIALRLVSRGDVG